MFVMMVKYIKPLEEIDKYLPAHKEYLDIYFASGNFICCGRQNPRVGGVILCNASDITEAQRISSEDPFVIQQVAEHSITEFAVTKMAPGFEPFANKL